MLNAEPVTTTAAEALAIHQELIAARNAQRVASADPTTTLDAWQAACRRYDSAVAAVYQLRSDEAEAA